MTQRYLETQGKGISFSSKNILASSVRFLMLYALLFLLLVRIGNQIFEKIIKNVYENKKIIGAVCHGLAALLNVKLTNRNNLLKGKKINSFTKAEEKEDKHTLEDIIPFMLDEELIKQGAIFSLTKPFQSYVINDGNLVTGQNPESASNVALKMIDLLSK